MNRRLFLLTVLALVALGECSKKAKPYKINLDSPVKEQITPMINDFKTVLLEFLNVIYPTLNDFVKKNLIKLKDVQKKEWVEYVTIVSELLKVDFTKAAAFSAFYEIFCTSIVIQKEDGEIFLGRDLDFEYTNYLKKVTFEAKYYKGGKHLFTGSGFAGYYGVLNGSRPGVLAITANQRKDGAPGRFQNLLNGLAPFTYPLFHVLSTSKSFDEALKYLQTEKVAAPVYYIMGGTKKNEGVVVSREVNTVHKSTFLDVDSGRWFLVQTNYDRDVPDPASDRRRIPAENSLKELGRSNACYSTLYQILTQEPLFGPVTAYTSIMSPKGHYETWIHDLE